ncbi:MAG TPA: cysteine desulfurase family protein [Acidimicrobiales bacterium]|nr:cysteine desulfurase family protein [Acidimicrobiales bacterium]
MTYLDHAASTPVRPESVAAMLPFLTERFGNPSGAHAMARDARNALDDARITLADALGCAPGEIVFTSGGTEADNTVVYSGLARGTVVCSAIEHHAVLEPVQRGGGRVVRVTPAGVVDLDAVEAALDPSVAVVSVMLANNEIGTIQPLDEVAEIVRARAPQAALHTDAVQAFPWLDVAGKAQVADLVSISAHKFGGPKGVGVVVVRDGTPFSARQVGGGQERERRSGTQNVGGIVAMAEAARLTVDERKSVVDRVTVLRDRLADGLIERVPDTIESGDRSRKVAGNCHLCFDGIESEALLFILEQHGVMASAAASCASGAQDPSHVLAALGFPRHLAQGSLRLSLGTTTVDDDVDTALEVIPPAVARLRERGS